MVNLGPLPGIKLDPFSFYWVLRMLKSEDPGEEDLMANEVYSRLMENPQYVDFFESDTLVEKAYVALSKFMITYELYARSIDLQSNAVKRIWNYRKIRKVNAEFHESLAEMRKACNEYEFIRKLSLQAPKGLIFKLELERYLT